MVAYSFKDRFVDPILTGRKRQTIRAQRRRHARREEELQLYRGMRTRECVLIARAICWTCENVELCFHMDSTLEAIHYPDRQPGEVQCDINLDAFAERDGFRDWAQLRLFWQLNHPMGFAQMREPRADDPPDEDHRGRIFCGVIITWGPLLTRGSYFNL